MFAREALISDEIRYFWALFVGEGCECNSTSANSFARIGWSSCWVGDTLYVMGMTCHVCWWRDIYILRFFIRFWGVRFWLVLRLIDWLVRTLESQWPISLVVFIWAVGNCKKSNVTKCKIIGIKENYSQNFLANLKPFIIRWNTILWH